MKGLVANKISSSYKPCFDSLEPGNCPSGQVSELFIGQKTTGIWHICVADSLHTMFDTL